jgi:hypothetical protein
MREARTIVTYALGAGLVVFAADAVMSQPGGQLRPAVTVTVPTPEPQRFEVALDEVELRWTTERPPGDQPRTPDQAIEATVERATPAGAVISARNLMTLEDVNRAAREIERSNPGSAAFLVLYEPDRQRSESTRRLLGREVAVILTDTTDPTAFLATLDGLTARPLPAVPRAYVVEAADPLDALAVADRLRASPGVRTAYALLRRQAAAR